MRADGRGPDLRRRLVVNADCFVGHDPFQVAARLVHEAGIGVSNPNLAVVTVAGVVRGLHVLGHGRAVPASLRVTIHVAAARVRPRWAVRGAHAKPELFERLVRPLHA